MLERAVRLAEQLGPDAARVVLPVAAHGCAAGAEVPHAFLATSDTLAGAPRAAAEVVHECGRALLQFWLPSDDDVGRHRLAARLRARARPRGGGGVGARADAAWRPPRCCTPARWPASTPAPPPRRPAIPAEHPDVAIAAAVARGSAQTPRGIAVCLAAAAVALQRPDPTVRAGVLRLLETPRRERFTARELQPAFVAI